MTGAAQKHWGLEARHLHGFGARERAAPQTNAVDRALLQIWGRLAASPLWPPKDGAKLAPRVEQVRASVEALEDEALRTEAEALRTELTRHGYREPLVIRAFALICEATRREMGFVQRKEQLAGAKALLNGYLVEMATGEGKTVTALLAAGTAALAGRRTHVVTVNSYLAGRDREICGPVLARLGLTSAAVVSDQDRDARMRALCCDVVYADNKELAFEYLREHIASERRRSGTVRALRSAFGKAVPKLMPPPDFAIVDEADSVLVDEARTPLIIAERDDAATPDWCAAALKIAGALDEGHAFTIDLRRREARLTQAGQRRVAALAAADEWPGPWRAAVARREMTELALSALHLFERDRHYIVEEDKIVIVDESTGRAMPDRAWQAGLHQLIETKEGVPQTAPRVTTAKISFRALFGTYRRLSGMTGTGRELAGEMRMMFLLPFQAVASHQTSRRYACPVSLHVTGQGKRSAIAREAGRVALQEGRAVLIGTRSVDASEAISAELELQNVPHVVLNARQSAAEAEIVAQAGVPSRVTVATNMAGRGTDIKLSPEVHARGGLHVILSEFHASARIDRQLIGRAARAGDPGSFRAYIASSDELITTNAPSLTPLLAALCRRPGPVTRWLVRRVVSYCQSRAEGRAASQRRLLDHQLKEQNKLMEFAGDR